MSNKDSRTINTVRNVKIGIISTVISIILPFINKTAIIWLLGAEFTGLDGLFSSVLSVLNLAELGFNEAIVYSLYRPIEERDECKIRELITIYRKVYGIVGTVVFGIGFLLMPFLPYFIRGSYPDSINIYLLYLLYLINSGISYFLFSYKEVLLIADQRRDVLTKIRLGVNILRYLFQFVILLITRNFILYLVVSVIGTIVTNLLIQQSVNIRYPNYQCIKNIKIKLPIEIKKQVTALMLGRICDISRNSFDNIVSSIYMGLVTTAVYGNYFYIYNAVSQFMLIISSSMNASVGNSIVTESVDKNYRDLLKFTFIFAWISGWCTITMACLYQPFMQLWVGKDLMFKTIQMELFCIYFYCANMAVIRNQYIAGNGLWVKQKMSYVVEAILNLILDFVLGKYWGVNGILMATIITIITCNFLWRNVTLFKNYFTDKSYVDYLKIHSYCIMVIFIAWMLTYSICIKITDLSIVGFLIKILLCIVFPNIVMWLLFKPLKQYKESVAYFFSILRIKW